VTVRYLVLALAQLGMMSAPAAAVTRRASSPGCQPAAQVSTAAGFPVTLVQSLGGGPAGWNLCQYEMSGRYRGNFLQLGNQPASRAPSIFEEMKRSVKGMNGQDAEAERLDVGSEGWAWGSGSKSEAAAVVGSRVYRATLEYPMAASIGDQKEAMVRVLKVIAR
jgi:hypothetical protein